LNADGIIDFNEYLTSMKRNSDLFEWFEVINKGITNQRDPIEINKTGVRQHFFADQLETVMKELET